MNITDYSNPAYSIVKTTKISALNRRDRKCIETALTVSTRSRFDISRRIGSCILLKGEGKDSFRE